MLHQGQNLISTSSQFKSCPDRPCAPVVSLDVMASALVTQTGTLLQRIAEVSNRLGAPFYNGEPEHETHGTIAAAVDQALRRVETCHRIVSDLQAKVIG